jgi:ectoine hydroxylase-related dioxygenase (phytanoyl-CoA dioxygenase family)
MVANPINFRNLCKKKQMLHQSFSVSQEQVAYFNLNGHAYIPGIISAAELQPYRQAILDWAADFRAQQKPMEERDTYGKAFLQMMNLWESSETVKEFTMAKRFASVAAQLLGVKNVRLYHDQALFKEPGGGHTPWHQDQYYWPLDTPKTVTMWMPLVDIEEGMGMLTFASKSSGADLPKLEISDESESLIGDYVAKQGYEIVAQKSMKAGDATFHLGWTLHNAPGNNSAKMREVMTVIYMDAEAKVIEPLNPNQEADRQRWLQGLAPGSPAASALNPLIGG